MAPAPPLDLSAGARLTTRLRSLSSAKAVARKCRLPARCRMRASTASFCGVDSRSLSRVRMLCDASIHTTQSRLSGAPYARRSRRLLRAHLAGRAARVSSDSAVHAVPVLGSRRARFARVERCGPVARRCDRHTPVWLGSRPRVRAPRTGCPRRAEGGARSGAAQRESAPREVLSPCPADS